MKPYFHSGRQKNGFSVSSLALDANCLSFHRCWSQIGRQGEIQQLSLGKGCETRGRAIHELMHGIGFYHEQSRQDRDQHVKILLQNVENGECTTTHENCYF